MQFRSTLILGVILAGLLLYMYFVEADKVPDHEEELPVLVFSPAGVSEIKLTYQGTTEDRLQAIGEMVDKFPMLESKFSATKKVKDKPKQGRLPTREQINGWNEALLAGGPDLDKVINDRFWSVEGQIFLRSIDIGPHLDRQLVSTSRGAL